jgi:mRNA interferase HigB
LLLEKFPIKDIIFMRIISRKTLVDFWNGHPQSKEPLKAWYKEAEHAHWKSFVEIKRRYGSADPVSDNRVVFNIKGNDFRLVVKIHYNTGIIFIRFVGTHAEYDKIDAEKV